MFWTAAGMGLPETVDSRYEDGSINYWVVLFFGSYVLILNWTLLQVRCGQLPCAKYYLTAAGYILAKNFNDFPAVFGIVI